MAQNFQVQTLTSQSIPSLQLGLTQIEERVALELTLARSMDAWLYRKGNGLPSRFSKHIQNMKMTKSSQNCTICLSGFCTNQIIKRMPCRHIFHRQCAKSWLKKNNTCPNCRFDLQEHFECLEKLGKLCIKEKSVQISEGEKNFEKSEQQDGSKMEIKTS